MSEFDTIALMANPQIRLMMLDLVRELKKRHGSTVHLYCWTKEEVAFYEKRNTDGFLASVNLGPTPAKLALQKPEDPDTVIEKAREWERKIERTYASLNVANRHLGRGYALGGFYHPRSKQALESTYESTVNAYNVYFEFWEKEFQSKAITFVLGGPAEIPSICRVLGIPFRKLAGSRHKNKHFWTYNEFNESTLLPAVYKGLDLAAFSRHVLDKPYKLVGTTDALFLKKTRFTNLVGRLADMVLRHMYWRVRGYEKARGYLLSDQINMIYRMWRDSRRMSGKTMVRLADLQSTRYVFFPLATEPEVALQQFSPEFFFQHAAIAALSRDLPSGVKLVVKESNVGVGRRPDNMYEQIAELKNVVWMDIREPGFAVAQKADAVAVITGSSGFEAATTGTPVISFGAHNHYNMLPHVSYVSDLANLSAAVNRVFDGSIDRDEAARSGAAYLQAVIDTSFDLGSYDYVDMSSYDEQVITDACDALENEFPKADQTANLQRSAV